MTDELDADIGDLNIFTAYLFDTGNPAVSFGLGPQDSGFRWIPVTVHDRQKGPAS